VERVSLHQTAQIDEVYSMVLTSFQQRAHESMSGMSGPDAAQMQAWMAHVQAWLTSPEGHAGIWALSISVNCVFLLLFAVGGGALGARIQSRNRRTEA
jgi:hypothetical protein